MIFPMVLAGATVTGIKGKQLGQKYKTNNNLAKTISNTTDNLHKVAILNLNKNKKIAKNKILAIEKYKIEFLRRDFTEFLALSNKISNYTCNRKRLGQEMINIINLSVLDEENSNLALLLKSNNITELNLYDDFLIDGINLNGLLNIKPYNLELVSEKNLSKAISRYKDTKSIIFNLRRLNETMLDYQRNCLIALKYYDEFITIYRDNLKQMEKIIMNSELENKDNFSSKLKKILFSKNKINYLRLNSYDRKVLDKLTIMSDLILEAFRYEIVHNDGKVNINLSRNLKKLRVDI